MNLQREGRSAAQPLFLLPAPLPSRLTSGLSSSPPQQLFALHKLLQNDGETFKPRGFGPGNSLSASFHYTRGKQNLMSQQDPQESRRTRLVDSKGDVRQYMSLEYTRSAQCPLWPCFGPKGCWRQCSFPRSKGSGSSEVSSPQPCCTLWCSCTVIPVSYSLLLLWQSRELHLGVLFDYYTTEK